MSDRDFRSKLRADGCAEGHGCNAARMCVCGLVEDCCDEIDALREQIVKLTEALEPFAKLYDKYLAEQSEDKFIDWIQFLNEIAWPLFKECECARAALPPTQTEKK